MTTTLPITPTYDATPTVDIRTIGIEPAPAHLGGDAMAHLRHARTAIVLRYGAHASVLAADTDLEPDRRDTRVWQARFLDVLDRLAARFHAVVLDPRWPACGWCGLPQSGDTDGCVDEFGHRGLYGQRETTWRGQPVDGSVDADLTVWSPR